MVMYLRDGMLFVCVNGDMVEVYDVSVEFFVFVATFDGLSGASALNFLSLKMYLVIY